MKKIYFTSLVLALMTFVFSCQKPEATPNFPANTSSFAVQLSTSTVSVTAKDSLTKVLVLSWNDPKFNVGLENSKFVVMIDSTGKNFTKSFYSMTFNGTLKDTLKAKEVNNIALKLGGKIGQNITLDVVVIASAANGSQAKSSAPVQLTVSPYGDLNLSTTSSKVVCAPSTATNPGDTLTWTEAFVGYTGVKHYVLQYAKGGTNFASPTTVNVTGYTYMFSQRDLNLLAQAVGISAPATGDVDFRIKATTETGTAEYSNVKTVSITTYVAYNSIGLIGDFTGWGNDVDLYRPDPINAPADWTVTLHISSGGVKFRADDGWNVNWGAASYPSGTATQGGANIPISATGYYKVNFNVASGYYSFTALPGTTYSVTVAGDFNGWSDTSLSADASGHIWTGTISVAAAGGIKFKGDPNWVTNWGSSTFPSGYGVQNGSNIPIAAGNYFVWFNDVSGEYAFGSTSNSSPYTAVGVVGDFTSWGSSPDIQLIQNPDNGFKWSAKITLPSGASQGKFRANSAWTVNWGSSNFPSGVGTQGGNNIPVVPGTYQVTLNSLTGEYYFWQ